MIGLCKFYRRESNNLCELVDHPCITDSRDPIDCCLLPSEEWTFVRVLELNKIHLDNLIALYLEKLKSKSKENFIKMAQS
jgi:hypothetical protein